MGVDPWCSWYLFVLVGKFPSIQTGQVLKSIEELDTLDQIWHVGRRHHNHRAENHILRVAHHQFDPLQSAHTCHRWIMSWLQHVCQRTSSGSHQIVGQAATMCKSTLLSNPSNTLLILPVHYPSQTTDRHPT